MDRDRLHLIPAMAVNEAEERLEQAALVLGRTRANFCAHLLGSHTLKVDRTLETLVPPGGGAGARTALARKRAAAFSPNVCLALHQGSIERHLTARSDLDELHGRPPWDD